MSTQVQYRRGSSVQVAAFTGALGELVIDTTNKIVVVNDGATAGGFPQVGLTAAQTLTNKTLTSPILTTPNIGVATGTSVSTTGNITGGNLTTAGQVSATANITGGNVLTGGIVSATGNITGGNIVTGGAIATTGASTAGSYSSAGNVTGGNITTAGVLTVNSNNAVTAIVNSGTNGVGNIGASGAGFNTVFAKATTAQYADLAEMYTADAEYAPGTLVVFGGTDEITISTASHDPSVAGIISTDPAYLMNSAQPGDSVLAVALTGRVPCRVVGSIRKGDRLVTSGLYAGVATSLDMRQYQPGCIIGKSLEDYQSTEVGTIEVAVGRTQWKQDIAQIMLASS